MTYLGICYVDISFALCTKRNSIFNEHKDEFLQPFIDVEFESSWMKQKIGHHQRVILEALYYSSKGRVYSMLCGKTIWRKIHEDFKENVNQWRQP